MIKIIFDRGRYCPWVFCDHCGARIEDAREGNIEHPAPDLDHPGDYAGEVFFVHKECTDAFEHARGGRIAWLWDELADYLIYLSENLKYSPDDLAERWHILTTTGL